MNSEVLQHYTIRLEKAAKIFRNKGFAVEVFNSSNAAKSFLLSQLKKEEVISYGGSRTIQQLNIIEELKTSGFNILDRNLPGNTPEKKAEIERQTFFSDVYLASTNALSEKGALVNIDLWGNRVAAMVFGPKKVYILIGRNKLCANTEAALERTRNTAAVMNCLRFNKATPCVLDGHCHDCQSPDRICAVTTIIEKSAPANRINLLLINEDLGF